MSEFEFKKGMKVEISIEEEGFRGAWFSGTIINPPSKNTQKVLIEYDALLADNGSNSKPLREKVDFVQIRPIPPRETNRLLFKLDEDVDAYYNDGWWEGVITQVVDDCSKYCVYFRPTREQCEFNVCDLRLHREWDGVKWVPPLLEEDAGPTEVKINGKEENPLCKGRQVEVSNDEDGFEGAWFAASIIEVSGKDKFLIEYHDLMTDDNKQLVREEVDAFHIRPCPPKLETVNFNLYAEVDALYNDGWWVGIISKVLGHSKYKVFFKTTKEEIEFKHEKLRLHQDWINRKWVVASEALNL